MIALIGCSKRKKSYICEAEKLYTGNLFRLTLKYCRQMQYSIFILSAKYGVLHPSDRINPYDITLKTMKKEDIHNWYLFVNKQLKEKRIANKPIICFCGKLYHEGLFLPKAEYPMKGLSIGKQLQYMKRKIQENSKWRLI